MVYLILKIFDFYDSNNDGYLSLDEIKEGFKALFAMLGNDDVDLICKLMAEDAIHSLSDGNKRISKSKWVI